MGQDQSSLGRTVKWSGLPPEGLRKQPKGPLYSCLPYVAGTFRVGASAPSQLLGETEREEQTGGFQEETGLGRGLWPLCSSSGPLLCEEGR